MKRNRARENGFKLKKKEESCRIAANERLKERSSRKAATKSTKTFSKPSKSENRNIKETYQEKQREWRKNRTSLPKNRQTDTAVCNFSTRGQRVEGSARVLAFDELWRVVLFSLLLENKVYVSGVRVCARVC